MTGPQTSVRHPAVQVKRRALLVVLSYKSPVDTIACLDTIYRGKPENADVLVVDNASSEGTVADLRGAFPATEILELSENHGWAGGNNAGIKLGLERGYDFICLLNNDLWMTPGSVAGLLDAAAQLEPCLLHPAIYYFDEPAKAQVGPSPGAQPIAGHPNVYQLDFAYGACLLVHREIFRRVGLLDERFFLQLEEADFHRRAVRAGYRALCQTAVKVLHKESLSIGKVSPLKTFYTTRNSLLIAEKHAATVTATMNALRSLVWTLRRRAGLELSPFQFVRWICSGNAHAIAVRRGFLDYLMRRFGQISPGSRRALGKAEDCSRRALGRLVPK